MPNHLAGEKSPYLLQHAENPVDWRPWGPEAFEKARREGKPVFLSIGYSTCHWCHVMAHESFENETIAAYLNAHFVPVKVDREERPDVDAQYMTAVQGLTGSGGWPLTAVLTPDGKPFFGGTYFPPEDRFGRPGLGRLLEQLHRAWTTSRDQVDASAETVAAFVRERREGEPAEPGEEALRAAADGYRREYDSLEGGFGAAPKFPRPHVLTFLLYCFDRTGERDLLEMVEHTLDAMASGGIRDHLGGGFARYSTDRTWLVPHFEKMLYDQALLAGAYLEAYQATGHERHAGLAREIFDYALRDLRDPRGGFRSAEDADSEGEEGRFYVWTPDQILDALGAEEAALVSAAYGVTLRGNFEGGATVLSRVAGDDALAERFATGADEVAQRLAAARERLFRVRAERTRPGLDDKVLTDWNGLMISALALGARVLGAPDLLRAATEASDFALTALRDERGLLHRYRDGSADIPGFLDDYAFLARGLFDLYQAGFDPARLEAALEIARGMVRRFEDGDRGGFFFTSPEHEALLTRDKPLYDGAHPSGNGVAAGVCLRLGNLTGDGDLRRAGERALTAFGGALRAMPTAYPESLAALDFLLGASREVVVAGADEDPVTRDMVEHLTRRYLPRVVTARRRPGRDPLAALLPFTAEMIPPERGARAYVCRERACERPVESLAALARSLGEKESGPEGGGAAGSDPRAGDR